MISNDPPVHTRLRKLVAGAFAPRKIASYAPWIQALIDALVNAIIETKAQAEGARYAIWHVAPL